MIGYGTLHLRFLGAAHGQLFVATLPVTVEAVEFSWETIRGVVRAELGRDLAMHGFAFPADPVVLCWRTIPTVEAPLAPPLVWYAWDRDGAAAEDALAFVSPDSFLLVLERRNAMMAARSWPAPQWCNHWHPTRCWREAAREQGVTAAFVGGQANGRRVRFPANRALHTIAVPVRRASVIGYVAEAEPPKLAPPGDWPLLYVRDPEPSGLAEDGSALWCYRLEGGVSAAPKG